MPHRDPITADYEPGEIEEIRQHDGQVIRLRKISKDYDPHDRIAATNILQARAAEGEIVTGLIYIDNEAEDLHSNLNTVEFPLNTLGEEELCPGSTALEAFNVGLQ
jgi:2-oxoglutarate ferredoxin oxidoreductase subunit beta